MNKPIAQRRRETKVSVYDFRITMSTLTAAVYAAENAGDQDSAETLQRAIDLLFENADTRRAA